MKSKFNHFFSYSESEKKEIWEKAIFVFDTNTLLDLYRLSNTTSRELITALKELKKRKQLWLPHQVGLEFFSNRLNTICAVKEQYSDAKQLTTQSFNGLKEKINKEYSRNPFLNTKSIVKKIEGIEQEILSSIDKDEELQPDWIKSDDILKELELIYSDEIIGIEYSEKDLEKIRSDGVKRYEKNIPPGFKDSKKQNGNEFGDLIVWNQIIDYAKAAEKPIIFITRDDKEEWVQKVDGETLGPDPNLRKEMFDRAGVNFNIYSPDRFLQFAKDSFSKTITAQAIKEVKEIKPLSGWSIPQNLELSYLDLSMLLDSDLKNLVMELKKIVQKAKYGVGLFEETNTFNEYLVLLDLVSKNPTSVSVLNKVYYEEFVLATKKVQNVLYSNKYSFSDYLNLRLADAKKFELLSKALQKKIFPQFLHSEPSDKFLT